MKKTCDDTHEAGVPNALGSIDAVHIRLWNVASNLKQVSTGKDKYPTRAFNVVANHRWVVLAAQKGAFGSTNDKTLVRFDRGA
jgi:hypothetical protein